MRLHLAGAGRPRSNTNDRASFDLDEFLARPLFAHLATASDLGPRDSPALDAVTRDAAGTAPVRSPDAAGCGDEHKKLWAESLHFRVHAEPPMSWTKS